MTEEEIFVVVQIEVRSWFPALSDWDVDGVVVHWIDSPSPRDFEVPLSQ